MLLYYDFTKEESLTPHLLLLYIFLAKGNYPFILYK